MRYEMVQCDDVEYEGCPGEEVLADEAPGLGWIQTADGGDLCSACADARAIEAEHDLDVEER